MGMGTLVSSSDLKGQKYRFIYISVIVALSLLGDALLYTVLPGRTSDFSVLLWQVGIILSANRIVRFVTNEIAGRILKKYGAKKPLLIAIVVGAFTTAGYGMRLGFVWLLFLRLVWGACWSIFRAEGYLTAFGFSSDTNRGKIVGIYESITRAGSGIGVIIGGLLVDVIGISPVFFLYGFLTLSGLFFLFLSSRLELRKETDNTHIPSDTSRNRHLRINMGYITLYYGVFALVMIEQVIVNLTGRVVADSIVGKIPLNIGIASLTGILLGSRTFGNLFLSPLLGHISDRVGRKKIVVGMTVLEVIILSVFVVASSPLLLVVLFVLFFIVAISGRLSVYAAAGDVTESQKNLGDRALYMNRFVTFADVGMSVGPLVAFSLYAGLGLEIVAIVSVIFLLPVIVLWSFYGTRL